MTKLTVKVDGSEFEVEIQLLPVNGAGIKVVVDGETLEVYAPEPGRSVREIDWFIVDGRPVEVALDETLQWVETRWGTFSLLIRDQSGVADRPQTGDGRVKAPIPGRVNQVLVNLGDDVASGQPLLILEAMKMENEIRAPRSGKITRLNVTVGQRVTLHELLVEID